MNKVTYFEIQDNKTRVCFLIETFQNVSIDLHKYQEYFFHVRYRKRII